MTSYQHQYMTFQKHLIYDVSGYAVTFSRHLDVSISVEMTLSILTSKGCSYASWSIDNSLFSLEIRIDYADNKEHDNFSVRNLLIILLAFFSQSQHTVRFWGKHEFSKSSRVSWLLHFNISGSSTINTGVVIFGFEKFCLKVWGYCHSNIPT